MIDDEEDFGSPEMLPPPEIVPQAPANLIPFGRQKPNPAVIEAWERETKAANKKSGKSYEFLSPLDAAAEMERKRKLPTLTYNPAWADFARRCLLYPGEMMGISGPSGGGKTSFAIEIARIAIGNGLPVLWLPLELDPSQLNLRLVANLAGVHMWKIRDEWSAADIASHLIQVSDRWRFVENLRRKGIGEQLEALRTAIRVARHIYQRPPVFFIDYIGKLARGSKEARGELADAIEELRQLTVDEECYGVLLSQTSRGNNAVLTGKVDLDSAADAIGVSAETAELEHAVAVNVALNVFKADDAEELDAHVLISKARNTGREGRVGFRFIKAGGQWRQLDHLPATPGEVTREVAKQKSNRNRTEPLTPEGARESLNADRAAQAAAFRMRAIVAALAKLGPYGGDMRALRNVKGCQKASDARAAIDELVRRGQLEEMSRGRWRVITTSRSDEDEEE